MHWGLEVSRSRWFDWGNHRAVKGALHGLATATLVLMETNLSFGPEAIMYVLFKTLAYGCILFRRIGAWQCWRAWCRCNPFAVNLAVINGCRADPPWKWLWLAWEIKHAH
jgi:hypothetical protein